MGPRKFYLGQARVGPGVATPLANTEQHLFQFPKATIQQYLLGIDLFQSRPLYVKLWSDTSNVQLNTIFKKMPLFHHGKEVYKEVYVFSFKNICIGYIIDNCLM